MVIKVASVLRVEGSHFVVTLKVGSLNLYSARMSVFQFVASACRCIRLSQRSGNPVANARPFLMCDGVHPCVLRAP